MRCLILSDLHGNWEALSTVLRKVRRKRFDAVLLLGDLVGYGAAPNQVIDSIRRLRGKVEIVRGNHDKVVAGLESGEGFNPLALESCRFSQAKLRHGNRRFLSGLRAGPHEVEGFLICHGSPGDEDSYVLTPCQAAEVFQNSDFSVCFFGHTHIQGIFRHHGGAVEAELLQGPRGRIELQKGSRYLINPGAVGQPRDRDPRAAYMIYDSRRRWLDWFRLGYPIALAQRRIVDAGLPELLAERLELGL